MVVEYLNISKAFLQKIYFAAVSVLLTILLGRLLGVDAFGQYSLVISSAFLLAGLSQSGGAMLVTRETARASNRGHVFKILANSIFLSSILFFSLSVIAYFFYVDNAGNSYVICVSLAFVFLLLNLFNASTRGLGWLNAGQLTEHVIWPSLFLLTLLSIYFSSFSLNLKLAIEVQAACIFAAFLASVMIWRKAVALKPQDNSNPGPGESSLLPKGFWWLALVGWVAVADNQLIIILSGALSEPADAGLLRVAVQGVLIIGMVAGAIEAVQAPALSAAFGRRDLDEVNRLVQQSCRISTAIACLTMLFIYLAAEPLIALLLGAKFVESVPAMLILGSAQMINALTGSVGICLVSARREELPLIGNVVGLAIMLALALLLVPSHGVIGAAIASAGSIAARNLIYTYLCWKEFGIIALPFAPYSPRG